MKHTRFPSVPVAALACALATACASSAQTLATPAATTAKPRSRVAFTHALPALNGRHLDATVVEVNYGPGESSRPHSHGCPVIGYVLSGAILTQVKGQSELVVHPGQSFYEAPNGIHLLSANASQTEPASFLAIFICSGDKPLSREVLSTPTSGER